MADNFIQNDINVDKYFLKIAPDFSVFNLAEKYFIDNNISGGESKLFYLNENYTKNTEIVTTFKRAMFRMDCDCELSKSNDSTFSKRKFSIGENDTVFVCISTTDKFIKFKIDKDCRIVGVCF